MLDRSTPPVEIDLAEHGTSGPSTAPADPAEAPSWSLNGSDVALRLSSPNPDARISDVPSMSAVERTFCRSAPWSWATRRMVLPWARGGVQPHGDLLELGSGNGAMAEGLARSCPDVHLTVTDTDPAMIAAAGRMLAGRPNVVIATADVTDLPFADESYDFVASFLMLHHVVKWPQAIREVARVLRPGGTFFGYDLTATRLAEAVHWVDRSPHRLIALDELSAACTVAGLEAVDVRPGFAGHVVRFRAHKNR